MANTIEFLALFGNRTADSYQPNGVVTEMIANSTAKLTLAAGGNILDMNAVFSLTYFDNMIDRAQGHRNGKKDRLIALMSREMISKVSALQTRVTRDVQTVAFEGGFEMASYRGVGLLPSDLLVPLATTTSPAVTATKGAGGSLADDEYFYVLSSVTLAGEQIHGTEDSDTTETTNNSVDLTWTADTTARLYYVYRGLTTGAANLSLLAVIAAKTYDGVGNLSSTKEAWSDEGTATAVASMIPMIASTQNIYLLNIDPGERGMKWLGAVSPLGDPIDQFFTYTPLATVNSAFRYMIEGFIAPKIPYPTVLVIGRRAKLA